MGYGIVFLPAFIFGFVIVDMPSRKRVTFGGYSGFEQPQVERIMNSMNRGGPLGEREWAQRTAAIMKLE